MFRTISHIALLYVCSSYSLVTVETKPWSETVSFQDDIVAEAGRLRNVHITYHYPLDGELSIHYGPCDAASREESHHILGRTHVGDHEFAKRHEAHPHQRPTRFVWLPHSNIIPGGCLHAFSGDVLVGRSTAVTIQRRRECRWTAAADIMEAEGPWFDSVTYLKEKEPDDVFVSGAKSQTIGIIGGGMSCLMTAHLLDSVGFYDWTIIEATARIGGRVHTAYLNGTRPDQYQYQEMGPMRFPVSITYPDTNKMLQIKDHRMVYQLADVLKEQNGNDPEYQVDFNKWIQNSANAPADTSKRRPDGTVPGITEVENKPKYHDNVNLTYSNVSAVYDAEAAWEKWAGRISFAEMANNVYRAH